MEIKEILDRLELLFSHDKRFSDLRRFYLEDDLNSMFRLFDSFQSSQIIKSVKKFIDNPDFNSSCLSQGQIMSKTWLINELEKINQTIDIKLGTVFLCGGWYGILATLLFEKNFDIEKIRSFDIDDSCRHFAEIINKPWVMDDWKFKAVTQNIHDIDFSTHVYNVYRSNGTPCELTDSPNTIINTSCEHIDNFENWFFIKIPVGKLCILQTSNWKEIPEHINCCDSLNEFSEQTPMSNLLYEGEYKTPKYTRFMRIGYK